MTNAIRTELSERKQEIEEFIKLLGNFESGAYIVKNGADTVNYPTTVRTTQKACAVLLLYNVVEATMTQLLIHIHDSIKSENVSFFELNDKIRDMIIIYFNSMTDKKNDRNAASDVRSFIDLAFDKVKYSLSYQEMSKYYQLYSGNLDSKEIKSTLKKYGMSFERQASELQLIKNARNKLAHGEISFSEYGRDLSYEQISNLHIKAFEYLEELINRVDEFINSKEFKKAYAT